MIIATGETLEKLERHMDALKCYWKAGALFKLANLYEKLGDKQKAAAAYNDFVYQQGDAQKDPMFQQSNLAHAHKFLANFYLSKGNYKMAHKSAQNCIQFTETREEGKNILKQISSLTRGVDQIFTWKNGHLPDGNRPFSIYQMFLSPAVVESFCTIT